MSLYASHIYLAAAERLGYIHSVFSLYYHNIIGKFMSKTYTQKFMASSFKAEYTSRQ